MNGNFYCLATLLLDSVHFCLSISLADNIFLFYEPRRLSYSYSADYGTLGFLHISLQSKITLGCRRLNLKAGKYTCKLKLPPLHICINMYVVFQFCCMLLQSPFNLKSQYEILPRHFSGGLFCGSSSQVGLHRGHREVKTCRHSQF